MLGEGLQLKTTALVSKVFEKLVIGLLITSRNLAFFLISCMVLGLLDQLLIFSQSHLIELLGFLTDLELLDLWHLIYSRLLTGFGVLVYFTNLSLMEFHVRYLALFLLFSVIDGFEWFWMESLHKNIQLMLKFLKAPFLVLHFSCCILTSRYLFANKKNYSWVTEIKINKKVANWAS